MNREETKMIMAVLKATYPNYYRDTNKDELTAIINLWSEFFADEPYEIVAGAVKRLIISDVKGFPPVIGQIKEQIHRLLHPDTMTEQEAWNCIKESMRNHTSTEAFNGLPPIIQQLIGTPRQLWDWWNSDGFDTVIASNFMRSYRAKAEAEKETAKLPEELKQLSSNFVKRIGERE